MENQINQRVTDAINTALEETRRATIDECVDTIWAEWKKYEKHIISAEAHVIQYQAMGDRWKAMHEMRTSLMKKMDVLSNMMGTLYDLKWKGQ